MKKIFFTLFGLINILSVGSLNNNYSLAKEYYNYKLKDSIKFNFENSIKLNSENSNTLNFQNNDQDKYIEFAKSYEKNYRIFEKNWYFIDDHNQKNDFKLNVNKFADTIDFDNSETPDDLMKNNIPFNKNKFNFFNINNPFKKNNPPSVDWRKTKYLTPVKDQKKCGSCWAFSATSSLETYLKKNNYKVERLSEQELVDCSIENDGCSGGLMDLAFDYCIENNGLHSNDNYKYNAKDNKCLQNCKIDNQHTCTIKDKVKGSSTFKYKFTKSYSVDSLKEAVKINPVCIAIDANDPTFRFYSNGVIEDNNKKEPTLNHAVLLIGYGKDEKGDYWIVQNSWGTNWGDNGYFKLRIINGKGVLSCQLYGLYPYND